MNSLRRNGLILFLSALFFIQCETPGEPDFSLSTRVDAPLIAETRFQFLGGEGSLIDTTSGNYQDLFSTDGDAFITLIKDETFTFPELEDLVPVLAVDAVSLSAEVGEIDITDFSSQNQNGSVGEANFSDLTGLPAAPSQGDPVPGGQSPFPINISFDTDYFVSASIRQGAVRITIQNSLGLNIDTLTLTLYSDTVPAGSVEFLNLTHNSEQTEELVLVDNPGVDPEVFLTALNADVEISWSAQTMQDDPGSLIVRDVSGSSLRASQVSARVPSQSFTFGGTVQPDTQEFLFTTPAHYAEIESGMLLIDNIINSIDLEISTLQISFPGIRQGPAFSDADSLVILLDGADAIPANNTVPVSRTTDLSGYRIFAENNTLEYNLLAETENTLEGTNSVRTLNETDRVDADIRIENLIISEAFGVPAIQRALLNDNDPDNGDSLDLQNETEPEVIDIDGIRDISEKLSGIEFSDASLDLIYTSNIGLPVSITGAFQGEDADGNRFYLDGTGANSVTDAEPANLLLNGGSEIPLENLIRIDLNPDGDPAQEETFRIDNSNSGIIDFFNQLPVSIRFIGVSDLNREQEEGVIRNPVQFQPDLRLSVPLSLRAENATFSDTTSQDLSNLPGPDDDAVIETGTLDIRYSNGIPLGFELELEFLDENGNVLTTLPSQSTGMILFEPAPVDLSGASAGVGEGSNTVTFTREQLDILNQTRQLRIFAQIESANGEEVRIRETDEVALQISSRFTITNQVN
ncbi:hypothetical protein [Rhodohalobacter mucosus]|uniref:Uncharacterized protein n=1 Tax=Rhodohalobacter mucosus TaxID=2079485 RepID=A0A316TQI1_9BACT|nr:hypothetical protein [Rhodohalobacter mucosus]PWN06660.1 hypothetical protein DDZ15_09090 [Rhodohalobacter mucosus]